MLHYVNDNKLGCHVEIKPVNRQAILEATRLDETHQKRKFFIENKTTTGMLNSQTFVEKNKFTPNLDNEIYYPYRKDFDIPQFLFHETDWTTFQNYH
jgi:hypothetical protein